MGGEGLIFAGTQSAVSLKPGSLWELINPDKVAEACGWFEGFLLAFGLVWELILQTDGDRGRV